MGVLVLIRRVVNSAKGKSENRIDLAFAPKHLMGVLRLFFLIALLLGAIFGIAGQAVALPTAACAHITMSEPAAMAGMPACCHDEDKSGKGTGPCKDMAGACVAMAGCPAVALQEAVHLPMPFNVAPDRSWLCQIVPILYGRSIPPEPYPPSHLG